MILITGATGEYGRRVLDALIEEGTDTREITALVRDAEKAESILPKGIGLRIADYGNPQSLEKAFEKVDELLFVSGSDIAQREAQHQYIVHAAQSAGVGHILYTSFLRSVPADDSAIGFLQKTHEQTEKWIQESGIPYTILRHALYLDLLPLFIGEAVAETGQIVLPAQDGRSSAVTRDDLALAAAKILRSKGHENKIYDLASVESYNMKEVATQVSKSLGQEIGYVSPDPKQYQTQLRSFGVPEEYIGMLNGFGVAQAKGELYSEDDTLEKMIGRKPLSMSDFISQVYGSHES